MHRKKLKYKPGRWLIHIINLGVILVITAGIYNGYFILNTYKSGYEIVFTYGIISYLIIKKYFDRRMRRMYLNSGLEDIDEMTGIDFEIYLYHKFKSMGYKVRMTPVTGDYGADLVLKKKREKVVVQAKRYHKEVGIAAVQEVIGSIAYYNADRGAVITNSFFTLNAVNLAAANEIVLWDRRALIDYLVKEEYDVDFTGEDPVAADQQYCPVCGSRLVHRKGRYGYFLGCSGYPGCSYTKPLPDTKG